MKNGVRVAICVMLVVAVLAMSLSVFADEEVEPTATPYPGTEGHPLLEYNFDQIAFIIWQLLSSWGIDIQYQDITEYTTPVQNEIANFIFEYLDDNPSIENVFAWSMDWYFGTDFWGNLVVNDTLLDDVTAFASWLENKLGLVDNASTVVNPTFAMGAYNLYQFNKWYSADRLNNDPLYAYIDWETTSGTPPAYFMCRQDGTNMQLIAISRLPFSGQYAFRYSNNTIDIGQTQYGNLNGTNRLYGNDLTQYYVAIAIFDSYYPENANYFVGTNRQLVDFLNIADIEQQGDIRVITGTITLPPDNPDYATGDGMTLVDGTPSYGDVLLPDSVSVNNLPAVVSTGTVSNPGLDTFWGFIPVLAEQTKDAIVLTRGLIYELPEELVVTFYAVMGGLILFGVIKLMREH